MTRVIIAGSRQFNDYELLKTEVDKFLESIMGEIIIISGLAQGADTLGCKYAKEKRYQLWSFPADWSLYGRAAGPIRNREMANVASHCIVFWDGKSRGSQNMIEEAKKQNLILKVVTYG